MKRITLIVILSLLLKDLKSQGIAFRQGETWESIKRIARKENKYIFMDAYATWCIPCKTMDSAVYNDPSIGAYFNQNFISVKIQIDKTALDNEEVRRMYGEAKELASLYNIVTLPTLIFFNPDGEIVKKGIGYKDSNELIDLGNNARNSKFQYYPKLKQYAARKLTYEEMPRLSYEAMSIGDKSISERIANDYLENYLFKTLDKSKMTNENIAFIGAFIGSSETTSFKFYFENREFINSKLGPNTAEYKIKQVISKQFFSTKNQMQLTNDGWDSLTNKLNDHFGELGTEVANGHRMIFNFYDKNWKDFGLYYEKYFRTALKRPDYNINDISFELFKVVEDKEVIDFACNVIMKYAMEEWYQNDPAAYDTYAQLLYKNNKRREAILWQERAVKLKRGAPDEELYTDKLEKMKLGLPTWLPSKK